MDTDTIADPRVLDFMKRHGGGFASNIAAAWLRADVVNSARLAQAFPDLYDEYAENYAASVGAGAHGGAT